MRAQQIVGEMLSALDYEAKSELVRKVAGVYLYVYRTLMDAALTHDADKVNEALRVLAVERETWRQVCEKIAISASDQTLSQTGRTPVAPNSSTSAGPVPDTPATSFSLEA